MRQNVCLVGVVEKGRRREKTSKEQKKIIQTESSWGFERINGPFDNVVVLGYWL